jgi:hypothetical protein
MIGLLNSWQLLIAFGMPLTIIVFIGFVLMVVFRTSTRGLCQGNSAVHTELARFDERLTSIEKMLRDIE